MLVSNSLGAPLSRLRFSISVTVAIGEPNNPTTNSLAFWLTARRQGLAGNGQYCGKAALSSLPGLAVGLPKSPLPGLSGCASQSLRRGVCVWLTALVGDPTVQAPGSLFSPLCGIFAPAFRASLRPMATAHGAVRVPRTQVDPVA